LETLPPEVRRHILSVAGLEQLQALVRASPTFHQQYLCDRRYILCSNLQGAIGPAVMTALSIYSHDPSKDMPGIVAPNARDQSSQTIWNRLTEDEAVGITGFYMKYTLPVVRHYSQHIWNNFIGKRSTDQAHECTGSELLRLTRAMYHFHQFGQVAGISSRTIEFDDWMSAMDSYIESMTSWEVEEMICVYEFVRATFERTFDAIRWDVDQNNPKFDDQHRPPTPDGAFDLAVEGRMYLNGTVLRGLPLLHTVLFKSHDHEFLVTTMQSHITRSAISTDGVVGIFSDTDQRRRYKRRPQGLEEMRRMSPLPFCGDHDISNPPLAWTTIWDGTISYLYGYYTSDESRKWGYVFWDAETLRSNGGVGLAKQQWMQIWNWRDPCDVIEEACDLME
ncbi:hypothetical protein B0I35DRAFT_360260, partial [Stachybotrys elegans]